MAPGPRSQKEPPKSKGWRGSRALWLNAAKTALIGSGLEAVKIQPLARALGISRTSFYWFFGDRQALLDALLDAWEAKNTGAFRAACAQEAGTVTEALLNLIAVFHDDALFEPQLDFAVRGWAHQSEAVATRVHAADESRLRAIRDMFARHGFEAADADVRARAVYLTQIGYISMQIRESTETRLHRTPGYVRTFCGRAPSASELARFRARLKADPMGPADSPG